MANYAKVIPHNVERNHFGEGIALATELWTAAATNGTKYGAYIPMTKRDDKMMVLIHNSGTGAQTATVKAGQSCFATKDLTVTIAAGDVLPVVLESGRFMQMDESHAAEANVETVKGCILIEASSADVQVAVLARHW